MQLGVRVGMGVKGVRVGGVASFLHQPLFREKVRSVSFSLFFFFFFIFSQFLFILYHHMICFHCFSLFSLSLK